MSDRPGNGRPIQFVHYSCGHSNPVRGTGATVNRPCAYCASLPAPARKQVASPGLGLGLGMYTLERLLGPLPRKESPND